MKVLVIDDKPDEREKAAEAVRAKGWECIICDPTEDSEFFWQDLIAEADAVITDLMWNFPSGGQQYEKPQGLLAVIHCLFLQKPVVICTNASEHSRGHHGEEIAFIYDGYVKSLSVLKGFPKGKKPFRWEEDKDWAKATELLELQFQA
ncbi:MAG: hypothetical protein ABIP54_04830 [Candidatus Andersenbacteria bacterium]